MLKKLYYYLFNYKLVECANCNYKMYIKKEYIIGTISCSNSCTFSLYNKYKNECNELKD